MIHLARKRRSSQIRVITKGHAVADVNLLKALNHGLPLDESTKVVMLRINPGGVTTRPSVSLTTRVSVQEGYEARVPGAQKALEKYLSS